MLRALVWLGSECVEMQEESGKRKKREQQWK